MTAIVSGDLVKIRGGFWYEVAAFDGATITTIQGSSFDPPSFSLDQVETHTHTPPPPGQGVFTLEGIPV